MHPKYKITHASSAFDKCAWLVEECSEVIQAVSKIWRFGIYSYNPLLPKKDQITNILHLKRELDDLKRSITYVEMLIEEDEQKSLKEMPQGKQQE